uniref:DUF3375 family protein n=1 Tax=Thauera sp. SDU_THAU2 TaxID=3136633 RepID=UPI00311E696A
MSLTERPFVGTESRLLALFALLEQISEGTEADPARRLAALRLGLFFGMDPRFWMNLQTEFDMRMITRESKSKVESRVRVFHQHAA